MSFELTLPSIPAAHRGALFADDETSEIMCNPDSCYRIERNGLVSGWKQDLLDLANSMPGLKSSLIDG